jgi:hypothetical protein
MHANAACNTAAGDLVPAAAQVQHAQQQQWLAAAASEVQLMQLLLQRNTPMAAAQERHLLDAVVRLLKARKCCKCCPREHTP